MIDSAYGDKPWPRHARGAQTDSASGRLPLVSQPPHLEARVAEMRGDIREFREQNTRVLNAMRQDLTDLRSRVDDGFAEMRGKLDAAAAGQQQIAGMLSTLIAQQGGEPENDATGS